MAFNPKTRDGAVALADVRKKAHLAMKPFRQNQRRFVEQFVGTNYSDNGSAKEILNPLLELFIETVMRQLVARNPKVMVRGKPGSNYATARSLEAFVNDDLRRINFAETAQLGAMQALFAPLSVALTGPNEFVGKSEVTGDDLYRVTTDVIPFEDLVVDMGASSWREMTFVGHRYSVPFDDVRNLDRFSKKVRRNLTPDGDSAFVRHADEQLIEIAVGTSTTVDFKFEEHIDLWDVFLPDYGVVVTYADQNDEEPLIVAEWDGPPNGPYQELKFTDVPGHVLGLSPIASLIDLHLSINRLARKVVRQGENQKTIFTYRGQNQETAERVRDADDLDMIPVADPNDVVERDFGGVDGPTAALVLQLSNWFDQAAGNLSALAGLGPSSDTVGQDEMIQASASRKIANMQERLVNWTQRVIKDRMWYMWRDPLLDVPILKQVPGFPEGFPTRLNQSKLKGRFEDYRFEVDPYSMEHRTPSGELNKLLSLWGQFIMPSRDMVIESGGVIDMRVLYEEVGRYVDVERWKEIIRFDNVPAINRDTGEDDAGTPKPAVTNRIHTRVNRPGNSQQGRNDSMIRELMGAGQQPSEASRAVRSVG